MLPFEEPGRPFVDGMVETVKLFITDPTIAYRRMSLTIDIFRPLIYGVLLSWVGIAVAYLFGLMIHVSLLGFLSQLGGMDEIIPLGILSVGFGLFALIIAPVFIVVGMFIYAVIVHLFLMMVGGDRKGFAATFRVVCYSNTSQLAQLVPFVGGTIAWVWSIILNIIGLAEAHRTTSGKAAAAVLLPIVACCVCMGIAVMMAIAFGIQASHWN